ncbi:MAG TPA: alpha/beta hydrolase [Mycobacteriales bacterium]|nr:alpha/beta hydrolase [Mycobacteriales bacterium]
MAQPLPEIVELLGAVAGDPIATPGVSTTDLRALCDAGVIRLHRWVREARALHDVKDLVSPGGVPVRLYLPSEAPLALHIHLHGGGWWMGSIATADPMVRELAADLRVAVLSVDYPLAPENPWPAAPEAVYEVLAWMAESYDRISIGGESAGANLAAVVALMARDRGGPRLVAQWLDVPAVDLGRYDDPSMSAYGSGYGLEVAHLPAMVSWYADDLAHPYVSPLRGDLAGLPPSIVTVAQFDPLCDQGVAYAEALRAADVPASLIRAEGHVHGSTWLTALTEGTGAWHDEVVAMLAGHHAMETVQ